ncbi:MAG TPA: hypothetical protein VJO14_03660 [Bacteroidota bacterium]|nr:hypothetical protein [Bacteroidota bacterium]
MKITFTALLMLMIAARLTGQTSYTSWDFTLGARNNLQSDSLARMGIRPDATPDFENTYDIPRPPRSPSGNYIEVYFPHSGGSYPPILGTRYAVDYQGPADPVWNLSVECSISATVTLYWDSSVIDLIEPRLQLFLVDLAGAQKVNMRKEGHYTFAYTTKRDFQVVGAIKVDLTYLMEGFWNGASQVQDTVGGYLAGASGAHTIVDSARIRLDANGDGMLVFPDAPTGSYYLLVRHRNHLETWTASPQSLTKGTTSFSTYDFSSGAGTAYGSGSLKPEGPVFVSWGGDVNQDGVVDYLDRNITWNNRTLTGYLPSDCNGDNTTNGADDTLVLDNRLRARQKP